VEWHIVERCNCEDDTNVAWRRFSNSLAGRQWNVGALIPIMFGQNKKMFSVASDCSSTASSGIFGVPLLSSMAATGASSALLDAAMAA